MVKCSTDTISNIIRGFIQDCQKNQAPLNVDGYRKSAVSKIAVIQDIPYHQAETVFDWYVARV